jgi:galactonate dehydratase
LKEIAAMAEPYFIGVSPHNYNSTTVGLAATLQLCAAIPNFIITEYFINLESFENFISKTPLQVENGYIKLPNTPGLGIELEESMLKKFPYKQFPPNPPTEYFDEGP